jgi:hypothetical protein
MLSNGSVTKLTIESFSVEMPQILVLSGEFVILILAQFSRLCERNETFCSASVPHWLVMSVILFIAKVVTSVGGVSSVPLRDRVRNYVRRK